MKGAIFPVLLAAVAVAGQTPAAHERHAPGPNKAVVAHGEYLATRVIPCGDCHTPMDQHGQPVMSQWLQGAQLPFKPAVPIPNWADKAPDIAGLPGWTDQQAMKFFMTGEAYNGLPAAPPMPRLRLNHADAVALVAYLRSLKAAPGADLNKDVKNKPATVK